MTKRPLPITLVGWFFIVAGLMGFVYHLTEPQPFDGERLLLLSIRLVAVLGGAFVLRGSNWARWLLVFWMAYHVVLSFWHTTSELLVHVVFLAVVGYVLLRREAASFFSAKNGLPLPR